MNRTLKNSWSIIMLNCLSKLISWMSRVLPTDSGDVRVTEELAPLVPQPILTISESALQSHQEVQRALLELKRDLVILEVSA